MNPRRATGPRSVVGPPGPRAGWRQELGAVGRHADFRPAALTDTTPTCAPPCRRRPDSPVTCQELGVVSVNANPHNLASCSKTPKKWSIFNQSFARGLFFKNVLKRDQNTKISPLLPSSFASSSASKMNEFIDWCLYVLFCAF